MSLRRNSRLFQRNRPIPLKKSVFEQDGRNSQREPTAS
jgi:hypothetical protein